MNSIDRDLRPKIIAGVVVAILALAGAVAGVWYSARARMNTPEILLSGAQTALASKDYATARDMAERSLRGSSDPTEALIAAGKAAAAQNDLEGALGYFGEVSPGSSPDAVEARVAAGELAYNLGRASEAEKHLRAALSGDKGHVLANDLLAKLLGVEGRSFEAAPFHYFPLKTKGEASLNALSLLAGVEPVVEDRKQIKLFLSKSPSDNAPLIAKARAAMSEHKMLEARSLLERIVGESPGLIEAQARYGELLLSEAPERLDEWNSLLPDEAEGHPVVWLVRGRIAERDGKLQTAARCYWQAIQLDPTHAGATHHLGKVLQAIGRPEAALVVARAAALQELGDVANDIRRSLSSAEGAFDMNWLERAATLAEQLGRLWEACGWANQAVKLDPSSSAWAKSLLGRLLPRLDAKTPRTLTEVNPGRTLDLSDYPLPSGVKAAVK